MYFCVFEKKIKCQKVLHMSIMRENSVLCVLQRELVPSVQRNATVGT